MLRANDITVTSAIHYDRYTLISNSDKNVCEASQLCIKNQITMKCRNNKVLQEKNLLNRIKIDFTKTSK